MVGWFGRRVYTGGARLEIVFIGEFACYNECKITITKCTHITVKNVKGTFIASRKTAPTCIELITV